MPIKVTCRSVELTPEQIDLFEKKGRRLKKYFDRVDAISVIFTAEKHRRICEISLHAGPFDCFAKAENGDEGAAFDKALASVQRQIKEAKNKAIDRNHKAVNPSKATNRSGKELPLPIPSSMG